MNWLDGLNQAIDYIEKNLQEEINYEEIADMFGYSVYHVQRVFAMIAGVPLSEYVRNRRLSMAAIELQNGDNKVIDISLKYGYSSPNSFNRAFRTFHGVAPSDLKQEGVTIKAYPPLCFELAIKGAHMMEYRLVKKKAFRIVGAKLQTTMENGVCYQDAPTFWSSTIQTGKHNAVLALMNQEPFGLLGVSNYSDNFATGVFDYYIASSSDRPVPEGMTEFIVPESTWAVFPCNDIKPETIQNLEHSIVMEWLPTSGYEFAQAPDMELYDENGKVEIWLPVKSR